MFVPSKSVCLSVEDVSVHEGVNVTKLFSFVTDDEAKYTIVFVTGKNFPV